MTHRNSTAQDRFTPDEIIQLLGIKKSAYYDRLKFLGIKAHKDEEKKAYLDSEQVELLEKLESHVKATGKMEGFEFTSGEDEVSEQSDIQSTNDVDDNAESGGELAIAKSGKGAIASTTSNEKPDSVIEQSIPETQPDYSQGKEEIIRKAAEIKAQNLAMPDLITLQLAGQMTFDDLPEDLQQKVSAVKEAASPKMNPASVASNLLAQYRSSRSGN